MFDCHAFTFRRAALLALLLTPLAGHAAGFDCAKAASVVEKAICGHAVLSKLDGELAVAWKKALAQRGDVAALKAEQLGWLRQRNLCGGDVSCLGDRYRERLAVLAGAPLAPDRWQQTWRLDDNSPTGGGTLTFTGTPPNLHFEVTGENGGNSGEYDGNVTLHGDAADFRGTDGCRLSFARHGTQIVIHESSAPGMCGEGADVMFDGEYVTFAQFAAKPRPDLLSLKVLDNRAQDAAAHALLGADYSALVDTINAGDTSEPDRDHLGAKVGTYFLHGLAPTNASIVMARGEQLWIGLLTIDSSDKVRMRYYTNVPQWKKRVPETIRAWHDGIDSAMPIDFMR